MSMDTSFMQLLQWNRIEKSFCAFVSVLLICLLAYNSTSIFYAHIPFLAKNPPGPGRFLPEPVAPKSRNFFPEIRADKLSSLVRDSVKLEGANENLKTHLPLLRKNPNLVVLINGTAAYRNSRTKKLAVDEFEIEVKLFNRRVLDFFDVNSSDSSCKFRFFMTWVSSLESFGARELFSIESLFNAHPNGCLVIVSDSLDSLNGMQILRPFLENGFKVSAISPDYNYLFNGTAALDWYSQLMQGKVSPGEVSLGQNLSNLLRLGLLYRFGGIYLDTDVIVLKSFEGLRNTIGAQTIDLGSGNWSRLNNAVMIFDEGHPLLYEFIQEFALTFNGNKWGHNGPYLVSRVVSRVDGRPEYNFTVLLPVAFYPVDWRKIGSLFQGPMGLSHSKWLLAKFEKIRSQSTAVHLWNKQSRGFKVEEGSIIQLIMLSSCVFCNSSTVGGV